MVRGLRQTFVKMTLRRLITALNQARNRPADYPAARVGGLCASWPHFNLPGEFVILRNKTQVLALPVSHISRIFANQLVKIGAQGA